MYHFHIADDHPLFRSALQGMIDQYFPGTTISESYDLHSTIEALRHNHNIDLLLLDLHMPGSQDFFGLLSVRQQFPSTPVAIISANEDPTTINRALSHGAMGYIPKSLSSEVLQKAIKSVAEGECWLPEGMEGQLPELPLEEKSLLAKIATLTPQQYRVLCYLREGWLNKQIAYELDVTEATVKAHITAIFRKLNVTNRTQAVIMMADMSL